MVRNLYKETKRQRWKAVLTDWLTTAVAFLFFDIYRFYHLESGETFGRLISYLTEPKMLLEQFFVPTALLFVYWLSGYYNRPFERSRLNDFLVTLYSQLFNAIIIYLAALTNDQLLLRNDNWSLLVVLFLLLFIFTYAGRLYITHIMFNQFKQKKYSYKTVIVGTTKDARNLAKQLKNSSAKLSHEIIGFLPIESGKEAVFKDPDIADIKVFTNMEELLELSNNHELDQVIIVPSKKERQPDLILNTLYQLFPYDVAIRIKPDLLSYITPSIRLQDILGEPFIDITRPSTSEFSKNIKRTIDVIFSSIALVVTSPLFLGLAIGIKATSKGPVLYKQERIGYRRRPFNILKFRSMHDDAEADGPQLSQDKDPRTTPIGRWMRKYRLDEFPQFINVIRGDMSLVGPRPERAYYIDQIIKTAPWYLLVLQVRPGITSWGMVKYGYASSVPEMIERNRFDLLYLANMSTAVDFKILIHTVNTVASGKGK